MVTKKSKSSKFLRGCIFEALMLLMDQKEYDDIAISEIAAKAGVSRMTYYRTYDSKEDILIQYYDEYFQEHLITRFEGRPLDYEEFFREILKTAQEHKDLIKRLKNNPKLAMISYRHFLQTLEQWLSREFGLKVDDPSVRYHLYYYSGAIVFLIHHWICDDQPETIDQMLDIIKTCEGLQILSHPKPIPPVQS